MPDNFEKQAQQQGAGYRITPREDVWNRISAELDQKKKRRIAWWWFPVGLAATLFPVLLLTNMLWSGNSSSATRQQRSPYAAIITNDVKKEAATAHPIETSSSDKPPVTIIPKRNTSFNLKKERDYFSGSTPSNALVEKENTKYAADKFQDSSITISAAQNATSLLPESIEPVIGVIPTFDLLPEKQAGVYRAPLNNTGSIVVNGQRALRQKGFWQIEVAAGLSNIESGLPLLRPSYYQDGNSYNYPTPGNGSVGSQVPGILYRPRAGASYSMFIHRAQPLSDQWVLSAGIGFQHLRFTQFTGARKDTSFNTQFAGLENKSLSHFYRAGNSVEHTGYFSRVTIASSIAYKLPVLQQRISLKAGLQTGYNVRTEFLVPDHSTGTYLPLSSARKAISASLSGGVTYHTGKEYQFSLQSVYDITRAYSPLSNTSNYWRQWQFSAAIPVTFKK